MPLSMVQPEKEYVVDKINSTDHELTSFLFSLGCYEGEKIAVVTKKSRSLVLAIKDARYNIDISLADLIDVEA